MEEKHRIMSEAEKRALLEGGEKVARDIQKFGAALREGLEIARQGVRAAKVVRDAVGAVKRTLAEELASIADEARKNIEAKRQRANHERAPTTPGGGVRRP